MAVYTCASRASFSKCSAQGSLEYGIPYSLFDANDTAITSFNRFPDDEVRFWVHYGLVILGFLLAVVTFVVQACKPAPYGRHSTGDEVGLVPVHVAYVITELVPGIVLFSLTYFLAGQCRFDPINLTLYSLFTLHYLHRSFVHPCVTRYSSSKVAIWMPISTFIANVIYHYVNADFIGSVDYCQRYYYDPRFIIGLVLFVVGFVLNRAADTQLVCMRKNRKDREYYLPKGPLFCLISCPNYLGEMLQWAGWAVATWSLAGLVWFLFTAATFIPRSYANHKWYKIKFKEYPTIRRALIPFVF